MQAQAVAVAALLVWCAFLFFYGLSTGTLYRTEALRAIIGAECLNGHWLVPTLYGEPFLTKPPGMYALIGLASLPFGEVTEASARLPSAVAATVAVLCFYSTLRRFVSSRGALLGAALLPVSALWLDKAPSAEIDMAQLAWVAVALLSLHRALEADHTSGAWAWWFLAMLAVSAGFLTKWTAPAFFYLTAVPLLIWRKQLRLLWSWPHLASVLVALIVVGCWATAVAAEAGWTRLVDTVGREAGQRFGGSRPGKPYPWGEAFAFPFVVVAANLPWSALAIFALRPSFFRLWDGRGRRFLQLLHCWTWPNLFFWALPAQHNVRYTLPMTVGLAGLGVMVVIAWADGRLVWPLRWGSPRLALAWVLIGWVVVKIAFVELVIPARTAHRHARETAAELRATVPPGEILYLCKLKDEGIMFYYGRPVRKLPDSPDGVERLAVLIESELRERADTPEVLRWFRDQQGDPFVLVRLRADGP